MKIHQLKPSKGAKQSRIRRGRGNASGRGTYSGRGNKGQNARSGGGVRVGFEGGQTPLLRRIPKLKGFKNINNVEYTVFNLSTIEENYKASETVSRETLIAKRLLSKKKASLKILGVGELTKKISFDGLAFSSSAKEKIEKAGGKITNEVVAKNAKIEEVKEEAPKKEEKAKKETKK